MTSTNAVHQDGEITGAVWRLDTEALLAQSGVYFVDLFQETLPGGACDHRRYGLRRQLVPHHVTFVLVV